MKNYALKNIQRDKDILYLTLAPIEHGAKLSFQSGQYATIGFRGTNGRLSPMRCFSITSSTDSANLQFATRVGGNFTHALAELTVGKEMYLQGPFGEFTINTKYDKNIVIIAGGIGITPFMSMIRTATNSKSSLPITLLYSGRIGEGIPFYDEIKEMEQHNPNLRVVIFATDQTNKPETPRMLSGRMTEKHIEQVVGHDYIGSTYFICGPKGFTENTESMLIGKGVQENRIIIESFTQSSKVKLGGYNLVRLTYGFAGTLLIASIIFITFISHGYHQPSYSVVVPSSKSTTRPSGNISPRQSDNAQPNNNYQQPVTSVS